MGRNIVLNEIFESLDQVLPEACLYLAYLQRLLIPFLHESKSCFLLLAAEKNPDTDNLTDINSKVHFNSKVLSLCLFVF